MGAGARILRDGRGIPLGLVPAGFSYGDPGGMRGPGLWLAIRLPDAGAGRGGELDELLRHGLGNFELRGGEGPWASVAVGQNRACVPQPRGADGRAEAAARDPDGR